MENVVVAKGAFHDKVEDSLFICYWAESNKKQERIIFTALWLCLKQKVQESYLKKANRHICVRLQ